MDAEVRWMRKSKSDIWISQIRHSLLVILLVLVQYGSAHKGEDGRQCSHRHPRDDEVGQFFITIHRLTLILEINADRCWIEI